MISRERLKAYIFGRRMAYTRIFNTPVGKEVLEDLSVFCRANETTFHENARVAAMQEGRREVWLRIQQHLNLSPEELFQISTGGYSDKQTAMTVEIDDDE